MNNKMTFPLEALCYSALPAQTAERVPAVRKQTKIKTSQFSKKSKLKIIWDFSTFFDTVKFDPLEEWLFRIRVGNLLLFRLKLRKFPKTLI